MFAVGVGVEVVSKNGVQRGIAHTFNAVVDQFRIFVSVHDNREVVSTLKHRFGRDAHLGALRVQ